MLNAEMSQDVNVITLEWLNKLGYTFEINDGKLVGMNDPKENANG